MDTSEPIMPCRNCGHGAHNDECYDCPPGHGHGVCKRFEPDWQLFEINLQELRDLAQRGG